MKKNFLLFLMALMCCVTGAWGANVKPDSGSGTKEDPYVFTVTDGDDVDLKAGEYGKFVFTATESGTLKIQPSGWDNDLFQSFMYSLLNNDTDGQLTEWDGINGKIVVNGIEGGLTYQVWNTAASATEDNNFGIEFESAGGGGDEPGGGDQGDLGLSKDNPYIATANQTLTVNIPGFKTGYIKFTAPAAGTLKMIRNTGFVNPSAVTIEKADGSGNVVTASFGGFSDPSYTFDLTLEANVDYIITLNNSLGLDAIASEYMFEFTEGGGEVDNPNAFNVVSTDPDIVNTPLAGLESGKTITLTLDTPVSFLSARIDGDKEGYVTESRLTPAEGEEGEPVLDDEGNPLTYIDRSDETQTEKPVLAYKKWVLKADMYDWVFYSDNVYTITLTRYVDINGWYDGNELAETEVKFNGATAPVVYSDIKLIKVTPDPNTTDMDVMLSSERNKATFEFDGEVKVVSCAIALGAGGNTPCDTEVEYTADGHTIVTATLDFAGDESNIGMTIKVVDMDGNELKDETPQVDGVDWFNGMYSIDFAVADGRTIDYLLEIAPMTGGYVEKLDKKTFTVSGGLGTSMAGGGISYSVQTSVAEAALYDADDNKVCDAVLLQSVDDSESDKITVVMAETGSVNYENFNEAGEREPLYTPTEVTTPGTYTLKIGAMSIGDGNFEAASPWLTQMDGSKGRCNPEWEITFNVVGEGNLVEVENIDPAPYNAPENVDGEYSEAVPAKITIKFNKAVETVGMVRIGRNPLDATAYELNDDKTELTINVPEDAQAGRSMTMNLTVKAANGQPVNYGYTEEEQAEGNSGLLLVYQTRRDVIEPTAVTPTNENLSEFTLTFDEEVGLGEAKEINLYDADDHLVGVGTLDYVSDNDYKTLTLLLDGEATEDGTYKLVIPSGVVEDITGEGYYNPELTYEFTKGGGTGINGIKVSADGTVKVYTIDGVYVGEGQAAEMLGKLTKGLYIVNGTKVAIK